MRFIQKKKLKSYIFLLYNNEWAWLNILISLKHAYQFLPCIWCSLQGMSKKIRKAKLVSVYVAL